MSDTKQTERLDYLVEAFKNENREYSSITTPEDTVGKQHLLRSLMNLRRPQQTPEEVLRVQDEYLKARAEERGIVTLDEISEIRDGLSVWQGDITRLAADAIVNAANSEMLGCFIPMHACIDNCIHTYAGVQLRAECGKQMNRLRAEFGADYVQPTAVPMLTDAYNLPSKKIIHIVGPIVYDRLTSALEQDLADCYLRTLELCEKEGLRSVAFCCISTGVFHFPNDRAAAIAVETVEQWRSEHPGGVDRVIFNVFKDEDLHLYETLLKA